MRGKAKAGDRDRIEGRITPAYAGKSGDAEERYFAIGDHPRLCGEKVKRFWLSVSFGGSPPPMRGKVFLAPLVLSVIRITPAYAGKSSGNSFVTVSHRDHPRLCGEKFGCRCPLDSRRGSPPPMRGKGRLHLVRRKLFRITPAYAGKRL